MDKHPEALRIAAKYEEFGSSMHPLEVAAAAELRRQHALIAELVKSLAGMVHEFGFDRVHPQGLVHDECAAITAAMETLSKAKEQQ